MDEINTLREQSQNQFCRRDQMVAIEAMAIVGAFDSVSKSDRSFDANSASSQRRKQRASNFLVSSSIRVLEATATESAHSFRLRSVVSKTI